MRRIINSTYITLDGIIENPQDWPSGPRTGRHSSLRCPATGRRTYEGSSRLDSHVLTYLVR